MTERRQRTIHVNERASEYGVLGSVAAARRVELGLRQDEVAELAGCSTRFVHALETGKSTVQLDKVIDVLTVLGLHLSVERGVGPGGVVASAAVADLYRLNPPSLRHG